MRAKFENGAEIEADVLIARRRHLLGRAPGVARAGAAAVRLPRLSRPDPAERVRDIPPESTAFLGPGRHFIHYFVSAGRMLNFVGHVEQDEWISENWTQPGRVEDLRAAYAGWHPQVQR